MPEGSCNPSVGSEVVGVLSPVSPERAVVPPARGGSGRKMLGCCSALWALNSAFIFARGPIGTGVMGDWFLMLGSAFVSGHLVPGLLLSGLGVGCRAGEFDGLEWLEGWGRGWVGFQVEREFGD